MSDDIIVIEDVQEVETMNDESTKALKVVQLNVDYLRENAEEYLTDDEKFMELLYSISDRSGVEKLLKMRFISGGAVPLRDILKETGKTKEELANYKFKFRKYGDKPNEKETEDNIVRELPMSYVYEGSFFGWGDERCTYKNNYNNNFYTNIKGNDYNAKWYSIDGHYNLKIEKTGEIYLKMRWYYYANSSYEGNGYYTFKIDLSDTLNFMNFLIDLIYEKNAKSAEVKNYFGDIY
jgi:hypothetical protein